MSENNDDKIVRMVSLCDSNDLDVDGGYTEFSWSIIKQILTDHDSRVEKDGPCFIPSVFKPKEDWVLSDHETRPSYRIDENIEAISMAVLDLDEDGAKDLAEESYKDFEYVLYTTHSYGANTPYKYRMVLLLDKPIPADEWRKLFPSLVLPIGADRNCGNLSRIFYHPSHNSNESIPPVAKVNTGKTLTPQNIMEIRKDYESKLTPEQLNEFKGNLGGKKKFSQKFHFTGKAIDRSSSINEIDWSYEGQTKTFRDLLEHLHVDNRHSFALSVTSRAVAKYGEKTDFTNLIQFMYKASTEYGSKPIHDPTGDTKREIPDMVISGIKKFTPELMKNIESGPGISGFRQMIREIIASVEERSLNNRWEFPEEVVSYKSNTVDKDQGVSYSYHELRNRNRESLKILLRDGGMTRFIQSVLHDEVNLNEDKTNLNMLGQFIFCTAKNYIEKVKGIDDSSEMLNTMKKSLMGMELSDESLLSQKIPNFQNFFRTSVLIGCDAALNNRYSFPEDSKTNENELSS